MGKLDWNKKSSQTWNNAWKSENVGNSLGSLTNGITGVVSAGVQNSQIADTTAEESYIDQVANTQFSSGSFDNLLESFDFNALARTNYTGKELRGLTAGQMAGNTLQGVASGATAGAQIGGPWGAVIGGVVGLGSGLIGIGTGNAKARTKAAQLNASANESNQQYLNNYTNAVSNTQNTMFNNSLLNIGAYGGPLFNHSENFDNGIIFIDEGGTHERNPLGGVPVGVDQEGTPNLVEEGEVIWNDYVFSNRLKPTKKQLANNGYKDKYQDYTFAFLAERLQDPERPNDVITQDSLNDSMSDLIRMQEEIRMKKVNKEINKFSVGGNILAEGDYLKYDNSNGFTYYNDDKYDDGYLEWLNSLSIENNKDLLNYLNTEYNKITNKNLELNDDFVSLVKKLGQDKKFGEFHSKLGNAYSRTLNDIPSVDRPELPEKITNSNEYSRKNDKIVLKRRADGTYYKSSKFLADPIEYKHVFDNEDDTNLIKNNALRYTSPLIHGLSFLNNLKKPDYSTADRIDRAAQRIPGGNFTPIGDYLNLQEVDKNVLLNPILANAAANRRAIQNQGLNAGQTNALLLSSNYIDNNAIGNALIQGIQANNEIKSAKAQFNRGTNQANAQMGLQALAMDQQRANSILNAIAQSSTMRNSLDAMRSQALSSSLTGIADDLGSIGKENMDRQTIKGLIDSGVLEDYLKAAGYSKTTAKNGGLLTKRKRRIK